MKMAVALTGMEYSRLYMISPYSGMLKQLIAYSALLMIAKYRPATFPFAPRTRFRLLDKVSTSINRSCLLINHAAV